MRGLPDYPLPELPEAMDMNLRAARLTNPDARFVGVSVNTSMLSEPDAIETLSAYETLTNLPCVDPFRTGVAAIVDGLRPRS
jgi:uncharacterized NAD-dependent epimerase/dehydratase family protein